MTRLSEAIERARTAHGIDHTRPVKVSGWHIGAAANEPPPQEPADEKDELDTLRNEGAI